MHTVYKGFNICFSNKNGAGGHFHVEPLGEFKAGGYATLNHAKGAITKRYNAKFAELVTAVVHTIAQAIRVTVQESFMGKPVLKASVSRNKREGKYSGHYSAPGKARHWRTGKHSNGLDSLKDSAKWYAALIG
jgi:hypothetical protein